MYFKDNTPNISLYTWAHTKNLVDWHCYCQVPSCPFLSRASLACINPLPNLTWIFRHLIQTTVKWPDQSIPGDLDTGLKAWMVVFPTVRFHHQVFGCSSVLWFWDLTPVSICSSPLDLDPDSRMCIPLSCLLSQLVPAAKPPA